MALLRSAVVALSLCAGASGFLLAPPTAGNANNRSPVLRHGTTTAAVRVCVVVWGGVGSAGLAWDRRASAPRDPDRVLPGPRPAPKSTDFLPPISDPKLNEQRTQTAAAPALRRHTYTHKPPPQRAARGQLRMSAAAGGASSVPKARVGILGASGYTGAELVRFVWMYRCRVTGIGRSGGPVGRRVGMVLPDIRNDDPDHDNRCASCCSTRT